VKEQIRQKLFSLFFLYLWCFAWGLLVQWKKLTSGVGLIDSVILAATLALGSVIGVTVTALLIGRWKR